MQVHDVAWRAPRAAVRVTRAAPWAIDVELPDGRTVSAEAVEFDADSRCVVEVLVG